MLQQSSNDDASRHPPFPPRLTGPSGWVLALCYIAVVLGTVLAALPLGKNPATALASATGIGATAMILAQFVTSGRFQWISGKIGLDMTMGFHRIAAAGILILVLAHIAAAAFQSGVPGLWTRLLVRLAHTFSGQGNLTGLIAYGLLIALFIIAKWFRGKGIPYEIWRISHGATSALIVLLVFDHMLRRQFNTIDPLPAMVLLLLSIAAAASLTVVYILRPCSAYGHGFKVESVSRLSPSVVELALKSQETNRFSFDAGQFAWIALGGRHTVTDNPFSIASAPQELPNLKFLIREAGDMTRRVISLAPGTKVAVDGPYGSFVESMKATGIVLVAGGIGIAPVLSLLKAAALRSDKRPYRLIYAVRTEAEMIVMKEIARLGEKLDLKVHVFIEDGPVPEGMHKGRITGPTLMPLLARFDCNDGLVFLCGPPAMMDAVTGALMECGFPKERVITERFDYDAAQDPISRAVRRRFLFVLATIAAGLVCTATFLS